MDADWRPQWRVDLIPSYKAHRVADPAGAEDVPDTLSPQVPVIEAVLDAIGIARIGVPGYEADDVIGTLAAASQSSGPVTVVTGDRDLFQLVDDARGVRVLYPRKGVGDCDVIDEQAIAERYGVRAGQYADFAALRGDPSDGLPGVAGVGEKTAARLVDRYGDLAGILAAMDDPAAGFAPGVRAKLAAARDYLAVAPKVVAVARDAPVPPIESALPKSPADPERLLALAEQWGLAGATRRLVDALAG
jgi:5'-3' exonuclease